MSSKINLQTCEYARKSSIFQDNLSRIIPGMIWYEDDTVSEELIEDKIVKSVVLFIKEGVVYGDTFVDTESSWHGSYKLIEKFKRN